jgi:tellurium resistance protein TerZ
MPINLSKGQRISLEKDSGQKLSNVIMGLGWDQKKGGWLSFLTSGGDIDLDASCISFDENKNMVDSIWFRQLRSKDGSIRHSGDNRTGEGEGDDEKIFVDLSAVPQNVKYLVFTISSFTGQTFEAINNAFCRLVNQANNQEIARYNLTGGGKYTAQIMVKLYRHDGEWKMHAVGEGTQGSTFKDMLPAIQSQL